MVLRSQWKPNKEEVIAENGVVTAMQPQSAEAGLGILKAGGNAVDAAVAMGFCNIVLEPYMATIGGMGYMLIHLAAEGRTVALDFNGRAPKKATSDMFKVLGPASAGGTQVFEVEGKANSQGALSVTVPGTCAGLCLAHERYGRLPLEQILEPAIHLAMQGFETNWHLTLYMANMSEDFRSDPMIADTWLPQGRAPKSYPKPGDKIIQRELGELLTSISKKGSDALHRGEVAVAIHEFVRTNGGLLGKRDLEDYRPGIYRPIIVPFKGFSVAAVPTPSGAMTSLETFRILDKSDIQMHGHNSLPYLHRFIEASRHAFADRYRFLGDWEDTPVPLEGLLSDDYATELSGLVHDKKAVVGIHGDEEPWAYYLDKALHDPWKYNSTVSSNKEFLAALSSNEEDTTHINVVDRDRNAVSCTHTGVYTPGATPPGTGVHLVGGMSWFVPKPGFANSISGWKRPLNNMAPLMVFKNGNLVLCQGAPGARRIINRGVQVVMNILTFGMTPQDAVARATVDSSGNDTLVDSRISGHIIQELRSMGHRIKIVEEEPGMTGNFSRPSAVFIDHDTRLLHAGVDVFRPAMAMGY